MGKAADIPGEFRSDNKFGRNASAVKIFEPSDLAGFKPADISKSLFMRF